MFYFIHTIDIIIIANIDINNLYTVKYFDEVGDYFRPNTIKRKHPAEKLQTRRPL